MERDSEFNPIVDYARCMAAGFAGAVFVFLFVLSSISLAFGAEDGRADSYLEDFEKGNPGWVIWSEAPGSTKAITAENVHSGKQALIGTSEKGIVNLIGRIPNVNIKENTVISFWYYSTAAGTFNVHVAAGIAKTVSALTNKETTVNYTWEGRCVPNQWTHVSIKARDMQPNRGWTPNYKGTLVGDYATGIQIAILPGKGSLIIDDISIETPGQPSAKSANSLDASKQFAKLPAVNWSRIHLNADIDSASPIAVRDLRKIQLKFDGPQDALDRMKVCLFLDDEQMPLGRVSPGEYTGFVVSHKAGAKYLCVKARMPEESAYTQIKKIPLKFQDTRQNEAAQFFPIGVLTVCTSGSWQVPSVPASEKERKQYFDTMCKDISAHGMNMIINFSSPTDWLGPLLDSAYTHGLKVLPSVNELLRLNLRSGSTAHSSSLIWNVEKSAQKLTLDGTCSRTCLQKSYQVKNFTALGGLGFAKQRTEASLAYDNNFLYIFCKATDNNISCGHDKPEDIWKGDCIEIFLSPSGNKKSYYHLITNPAGMRFSQHCKSPNPQDFDLKWNPNWVSHTTRTDEGWNVEVAIPFSAFGLKEAPKDGDTWGFNLAREDYPSGACSSWAPMNSNFHYPEQFGKISFSSKRNPAGSCTVLGSVVKSNGQVLDNAIVSCGRHIASTDQNGNFKMEGIEPGEYHIYIWGDRFPPEHIDIKDKECRYINIRQDIYETDFATIDKICNAARQASSSLGSHPALLGYFTCDEPHGTGMDVERLKNINWILEGADSKHRAFNCIDKPAEVGGFYNLVKPEIIMCDIYPVSAGSSLGHTGRLVEDLDLIRSAIPASTPIWMVLQAHGWNGGKYLREPIPSEIRAMTYLSLAHGAKGIIYFIYQTIGKGSADARLEGLLNINGDPTPKWDEVGKLSRELNKLAPILMKLNFCNKNIARGSENSDAQTFKDSDGNYYVMVVNRDVTKPAKIQVALDDTCVPKLQSAVDMLSGKRVPVTRKGNEVQFSYNLDPGDGRLFKLK